LKYFFTQQSKLTDIHVSEWIGTHNPSKRAAVDPQLRQRGHWERQRFLLIWYI